VRILTIYDQELTNNELQFEHHNSLIVIINSLLNIFFHFPYSAWTDAGAEAAADTEICVNNIFIGTIFEFFSADGSIVAGSFAHMAVPACSAGHAALGL
jgi:hypothetical protein